VRILLTSGIYKPDIGGPATYLPFLAQSLLDNGHIVDVITLKQSGFDGQKENWNVHYVNRDQNLLFRTIKTFLIIWRIGRSSELIFSNGLYHECGLFLRLSRKKSIAKVVGDPLYEREINKGKTLLSRQEFNSCPKNLRQKFQRHLLKFSLNSFNKITCPSEELALLIKGWGVSKPLHIIVNGVEVMESVICKKEYDLVTVSRLISLKNIDKLIESCALTKSRLVVVGDGPEKDKLVEIASKVGANVKFLGALEKSDVVDVLRKSKIFALLSDYEGMSFALLQAMSVGIPSIVSNVKGNTDVIENGKDGIVVSSKDVFEVSAAIRILISNNKMRLAMGKVAKLKVRNIYSKDKHMNEILELMDLGKIRGS
jgi:glycosyltransferase involved in cell wall biosynthesis